MRTTGAMCGTSMEPLAHPFLCSRAQMPWRHDVTAETWQATVLYSGLSAHLKQKAAPREFRRISDVCCRGVAGDLPVHLDVVTRWVHNNANDCQIASSQDRSAESSANEQATKSRDARRDLSLWRSRARAAGVEAQLAKWSGWQD